MAGTGPRTPRFGGGGGLPRDGAKPASSSLFPWLNEAQNTHVSEEPSSTLQPLMSWMDDSQGVIETITVSDEEPYDEGTEWYSPTSSINPPRPRTKQMSYNRKTRVLRVYFRSGGTYDYANVPGTIWYRIRQVRSPGRFIDRNIIGKYEFTKVK